MSNTQTTTPQQPCPACSSSMSPHNTQNAGCICGQTSESKRGPTENAFSTVPAEGNGEDFDAPRAELLATKRHARSDAKMLAKAIRNGWPIPDGLRAKVVGRIDGMIESVDDRTAIAACRAVIEMNKQNLDIDMASDKADRLDAGMATERVEMPVKFIRGTGGEGV